MVDLVADDEGDDLTDEERRALHETLSASWRSAEAGRLRTATKILDELRRRWGPFPFEPHLRRTRKSSQSTVGGVKIVVPHRICSQTNSPLHSNSLGTHRTLGADIGSPRYKTLVGFYSRRLAIMSTMSLSVTR